MFSGPRVLPALNTHGTGCTLAAALAAGLARGLSPEAAAAAAKAFVASLIRDSAGLALGTGVQRPMDHGVSLMRVPHRSSLVSPAAAVAASTALGAAAGGAGARRQPLPQAKGIFDPTLYVITTSQAGAQSSTVTWRDVLRDVEAAVEGGATCVQIREKYLEGKELIELTRAAVAFCRPKGVAVLVNDRLDVAVAADADGAHVGQSDIPAAEARRILGPARILGISTKTPEESQAAAAAGADYVGSGACFPTGALPLPATLGACSCGDWLPGKSLTRCLM